MDQPTEEERLDFARSYGVEPVVPEDISFKEAATFVAEMTPIVGDAMAAKEIYDELMQEEPNYPLIAALGGTAVVGLIPGVGDAAAAGLRKVAETYKRLEVDPDAVGMMGGNIRLKPKEQVDFDLKMSALDEAEDATTWQQNAKKVVKERGIDLDDKKSSEALELQESTRLLLEKKITRDEHLANVDRLKPVGEYDQLPREPSDKALVFALDSGKREKGVFVLDDETASKLGAKTSSLKVGDQFNSRLDIPAYLSHDTWIVAGTSPAVKTADGKGVTTYAKAVHFGGDDKPVRFIASQKQSEKIGTGVDNKTGYATVSGIVKDLDANAIRVKAAELLNDPEWTQVGFDPRRQGGFYVRAGENKHVPVREATEVIQIGPLVLAKNAKLDLEYQGYSEGGMALEEQMSMNFGDVPDNTIGVDPVSGNEIPLGSTAENVRDDIPAQLSEGEIVMAADVVRFHGVKLFEDLRAQAKMGYAEMAEEGRIGGEPMEMTSMGEDVPFGLEDLEMTEGMGQYPEEAFLGKFFASFTAPKKSTSVKDRFEAAKKRKSVDKIKAGTNKKPKFRNRAEEFLYNLRNRNKDRSSNKPKPKPNRSTSKPKIDFGFGGNPMERASRKYGTTSQPTKNESYRNQSQSSPVTEQKRAGQVTQAYTGMPDQEEPTFAERLNFGGKYNEGGLNLEGNRGGFGRPIGLNDNVGDMIGGIMEARTYQNEAGHEIIIMFLNGKPLTFIPEGYFPTGDSEPVEGGQTFTYDDMGSPAPQSGGGGGGSAQPQQMPQAVDYKKLSVDELSDMVQSQQSMKGDIIAGGLGIINPLIGGVVKYAMYDSAKKTKAELERRLEDPSIPIYEREYLENLLEIANKDKPSLLQRLFGDDEAAKAKATEGEIDELEEGSSKIIGEGYPDPVEVETVELDAEPYTPSNEVEPEPMTVQELNDLVKTAIDTKTDPYTGDPYVPLTPEQRTEMNQIATDVNAKIRGIPSSTVTPADNAEFIQAVKDDPESFLPPQIPSDDDDDKPSSTSGFGGMGPDPAEQFGGSPTKKKRGGGGRNKGGIATKKKAKKKK